MKRFFYYTDVLPFLSKGHAAIEKLTRNLSLFRQYSDEITFIWHPWSQTEKYLRLNNSPVIDDYLKLVSDFKQMNWGILDETDSLDKALTTMLSCNAYYGDLCELIYYAKDAGIPVMLQNIDV